MQKIPTGYYLFLVGQTHLRRNLENEIDIIEVFNYTIYGNILFYSNAISVILSTVQKTNFM